MDVRVEGRTLHFSGVLDEASIMDAVKTSIEEGASNAAGQRVLFDLSEVKRANSCGILSWLRLLRDVDVPVTYINTPIWLIAQFNMIAEFFSGEVDVESIQAPFYCPDDDTSIALTLLIGKDVPVQDDYEDFEFENRTIEGREYEPDFDPAEYFAFIAVNYQRFGSAA